MCVERRILSKHYPTNKILRLSFQLKLFFVAVEIILVIMCGAAMYEAAWRVSVVTEWIIALFFTFYMWSCSIDFFTTTNLSYCDDKSKLLAKHWDEEVGLTAPAKARSRLVNKSYFWLP